MTQRVWPPAFPLDPDARVLPAPLAAALAAGAAVPVILVVAGPQALEAGWATRTAVALAEAWSREGPRLVLADLGVGAPTLDRVVGDPNDEGLADVFLYGASLHRVIRGSATRGFGFIPTGTAPAESEAVLQDPGWRQVVSHFFRDHAVLLCYLPWSAPGLATLAARLGAVIALAAPEDLAALEETLPSEASVLAVVGPPAVAAPLASVEAAPAPEPEVEQTPAVEVSPAEAGSIPAEPAPVEPAATEAELAEPEPVEPAAAEPSFAEPLLGEAVPAEAGPAEAVPAEVVPLEPTTPPAPEEPEAAGTAAAVVPPLEQEQGWMSPSEPEAEAAAVEEPLEAELAGAPQPAEAVPQEAEAPEEPEERRRAHIPETPREALVEALWARRAGGPGRPGAAPPVDPVPGREVTERERLAEPFVLLRDQHAGEHRWSTGAIVLWLVIGALVAALGVLAYQVYLGNLTLPAPVQRWMPVAKPAPPPAPQGGLVPRGAPPQPVALADSLPYSVAIEAYPQYAPAVERAATLRRDQSGLDFFVTPALDHGSIYYHVMAGPVADSVTAVALMQRLVDAGVKTGSTEYDIVATRLAFDLGDFASPEDADARAVELARKDIPTYVVEVPMAGGPSRWRLYAGAFQGAADAQVLRPLLRGAGVPDSLVPRIGRSPR